MANGFGTAMLFFSRKDSKNTWLSLMDSNFCPNDQTQEGQKTYAE